MELTQVIKSPILTEKTDVLRTTQSTFVFKVDYAANKYQIKEAIETIFGVKVASVRTIKVEKQPKSVGRFHGFTNRYKKAMVKLVEGQSINYIPSDDEEKAQIVSEEAKEAKKAKEAKAKDVENKVAKKLASKKQVATKKATVKAKTTTKRKVGGE
ncbi:50S ribosomal protein L23 [Mycoplasma sp. CSL10137]|uniref:50S ribosomal protein L23 n=1 Tax=unclassified Mycoplasma TaxID=2683645 RepID=UPI00197B71AA|nr:MULTISPECIES: 50S ribosomal protein L23 [unclassified Mycoplasma]MBN4083844.1 50S ribosomal protein L23 [Mycoplasma sp. CSL10137]MBN4084197.1 50S ribosomal protein L23 [Mycoplasma sp. CSL10166]MBU4692658.1 50S ribosomal protein L23 [Mycoplasma sp. CSL7491-lung]